MGRFSIQLFSCVVIVLAGAVLSACVVEPLTPTVESDSSIYTAAARTMAVEMTLAAGSTAVAQLTAIAAQPDLSPAAPSQPPLPSDTPLPPTQTQLPPTATNLPQTCESAAFVSDVSVPPDTAFSPGEQFSKSWRIRNTGSCAWTPTYALVFSGGDSLSGPLLMALPETVEPEEALDISINLIAPSTPGNYLGSWSLQDPSGLQVPVASSPMGALWVQIRVQASSSQSFTLDFAQAYCTAQWLSNIQYLDCPTSLEDEAGTVTLLDEPRLESRKENETALWLRPGEGRSGWISGEYPPFRVTDGDHFIAEIGCLRNSEDCELRFDLDYRTVSGNVSSLGFWEETYDGDTTVIDLDLSDLAGETVQFILGVTNQGRYQDANGFWLAPHIRNLTAQTELVMSWRQEGGVSEHCRELKIYLTGRRSGEARARNCENGAVGSGNLKLNKSQVDQVFYWMERFNDYEFKVETPTSGESLVEKIVFKGEGRREALSNDILPMMQFMESLYNSIIF